MRTDKSPRPAARALSSLVAESRRSATTAMWQVDPWSAGSQPKAARKLLAAAISLALASAASPSLSRAAEEQPKQLPKISVGADEAAVYKADEASSPKFTAPLLDTPQTITVIKKELIAEQGATSLSETLRNTPGITFQLGENGNTQSGDTIFMRGFDTQNSIFVDGIRDLGAAMRDVFNIEQIEIFKGPAGADNGRGATSGYVNLASKIPLAGSFFDSTLSYGTEAHRRATADWNHEFTAIGGAAFRLNLMGQDGGVAGRDWVERQSWGVAPSLALGLGTATRIYAYSQHTRQNNIPDGAVTAIGVADHVIPILQSNGIRPRRVDQENYYGFTDDFEDIKADMVTVRIEHDLTENVTIRNLSRYGRSDQERILTAPLQVPNVADGNVVRTDPATWTVNRSRHASYRENEILTNQTNLTARLSTGAVEHSLSGGLEFIYETQFTPTYGGLGTAVPANLYNPDSTPLYTVAPAVARAGAFTDGKTLTGALYLFDMIRLSERWQVNGGLRWERYDTETNSVAVSTATSNPTLPVGTLVPSRDAVADNLLSWKLGLLFKPLSNGSIYVAYANSLKPPGGDNFALNASASNATTGAINANNSNLDPQKATNIEFGTKWDLLDGRLAMTAALFHSENKNDLARTDPSDPDRVIQYGEKEVEGIEFGVVGQITPAWQISAGVTRQDTEVTEGSISNANGSDTQSSAAINFSPKLSASLWTTYRLPFGLSIGGGARYVDTQARQINNAPTAGGVFEVPSYTVIDAFAAYDVSQSIAVQLNAYNLTDEFYVSSINNSGLRYSPGTPRSYLLTVNFKF